MVIYIYIIIVWWDKTKGGVVSGDDMQTPVKFRSKMV